MNIGFAKTTLIVGALLAGFCSFGREFPQRPFVLVNRLELANLHHQLSMPGWKADLYRAERGLEIISTGRGIRSNADLWVNRRIEIPTRGGHFHQFFCDDGDRLEVPKDQQFHPGPYRCPKCGKTYAGEKYEAALRCMVHHQLALATRDLALVAKIENEPRYGHKAAELLLKYAEAYPGPHTSQLEGGMLFQSLNEAMWVIPLAQAYDLICDDLSEADRTKIARFLQTVADGIRHCEVKGNWQSWHLSAVGVVGYALENEELMAWATGQFKDQIRNELGEDGLWPESVHTYHYFPLMGFVSFAEAAMHAGDDLYHWEAKPGKTLLTMFSAPLPYAYPDLRLPAINDGWFQSFVPPDFYELAFYRTAKPVFGWVLANGYCPENVPANALSSGPKGDRRDGLYAFLFGGAISAPMSAPKLQSTNFPVLGICTLRSSDGAMMTFDYGPFLGHGHRDKMGITLFAQQKLWAADYGTPGYGSAILPWYQSTFAHNTMVVDGKSQERTKENKIRLWLGGTNHLEAANSETREAYPGVTHSRTVIRVDDYFVVVDRLTSKAQHTYDFYLHAEGEFRFKGIKDKPLALVPPVPWIEKLSMRKPREEVAGEWRDGKRGVAVWIFGSSVVTPITGECPGESGSSKVPLLIGRQTGMTAEFFTVLVPFINAPSLAVKRLGTNLLVRNDSREDEVTIPENGEAPTVSSRKLT